LKVKAHPARQLTQQMFHKEISCNYQPVFTFLVARSCDWQHQSEVATGGEEFLYSGAVTALK
jgi:hypothetical protein